MGRWSGTAVLLLVAVLWGTMVPTIGHLLKTWDPLFLSALRYFGGGPALLPVLFFLRKRGGAPAPQIPFWRAGLLGAVGIGGYAGLYTFGLAHANPVTAAILAAAGPAVATVTDRVLFGRPVNPHMLPGLLLAICGCCVATIDFHRAGNPFDIRGGEILIIAAMVCWSWYSSGAQRWLAGWSQIKISCVTMSIGGVTLAIIYVTAGVAGVVPFPPPAPPSTEDLLILLWLILALVSFGVVMWNFGVKRNGIVSASLYLNLTPIIAILILSLGGTTPNAQQIAGGAMVVIGIVWAELATIRKASPLPAGIDDPPGL